MPRTAAKITQADVARVLRAIEQTGSKMAVQISPDGSIRLEPVDVARPDSAVPYKGEIRL